MYTSSPSPGCLASSSSSVTSGGVTIVWASMVWPYSTSGLPLFITVGLALPRCLGVKHSRTADYLYYNRQWVADRVQCRSGPEGECHESRVHRDHRRPQVIRYGDLPRPV